MAGDNDNTNTAVEAVGGGDGKKVSRRAFVVGSGAALAGGALATTAHAAAQTTEAPKIQKAVYPRSTKYLVYDSMHCAGCLGCMLACSLVHEGVTSLSLSRIQVHRSVLSKYPLDMQQNVCRQCPDPLCVDNCPTGAAHVSAENGNIRMIDEAKCIGCQTCIKSCPQLPHRTIWNPAKKKSTKCDLCVNTPFYNKKGGPGGAQACVEACPRNALKVVDEMPDQADHRGVAQNDTAGYDRNLQPPAPKMPFGFGPGAKPKGKTGAKPGAKPDAKPDGAPDAKPAPEGKPAASAAPAN
ncbi:MAG: 4Fe-4S dicluster domain-containing protein [Acidobacteriota bacterium]|jgi:protein NrfC|nr:4Fe-4S dicluster domain-containing protein [Acidobacteriota bacterium]